MDALLAQLRRLAATVTALPGRTLAAGGALLAAAVAIAVGAAYLNDAGAWEYAFTRLTPEDSAEMVVVLKGASVPHRLEAGGEALLVPAARVHEARLLLATAGLPRAGGAGFELFDQGDLGISEFTQKVNLRRALEGELARTISRLAEVRSARVHLTLAERGLYRDDDRTASAAVVLNLRGVAAPGARELSGIRHLVASAVPGLAPDAVTIVDGRGSVLVAEATPGEGAHAEQRAFERDLEQRITGLLEPVVGAGAAVVRVSATFDATEQSTSAEVVDPDQTALRSERRVTQSQAAAPESAGGVAGAAANEPLAGPPVRQAGTKSSSASEDETKNYEVTKTVTKTVARAPRLRRLSVAILLDGVGGRAREEAEVARLGELAKRAAGFDQARGDQIEISSVVFARSPEVPAPASEVAAPPWVPWAAAGALVFVLVALALVLTRRRPAAASVTELPLAPGAPVGVLEPAMALAPVSPGPGEAPDPVVELRDHARELASADPRRAARLLRTWLMRAQAGESARKGAA